MDKRNGAMIVVFLLFVIAEVPAEGHILDVCATCHINATCDDKFDGHGKVCNCMYGFVGNGRTFCLDKDECQIGSNKICGQHTTCHNTYGSYYCKCLSGYSPSNSMAIFIPNDGTHCRDVDECRATGLCGEGAQCRNLEGSFDCSCQLGYKVHNGAEPFQPDRDGASCKLVDCGQPPSVEDTVLLTVTGTTYRSVAVFVCDEGFVWRSGDNSSVCGADGLWKKPNMVCEVVDCGQPPSVEDTVLLTVTGTTYRSVAVFVCDEGFVWRSGDNSSVCGADGLWKGPNMVCEVVDCGQPPSVEDTVPLTVTGTTYRSVAVFVCDEGFVWRNGDNSSVCGADGLWKGPNMVCEVVDCGQPPSVEDTVPLTVTGTTYRSVAVFVCDEGFVWRSGDNSSVCGADGLWKGPNMVCEEVDCGSPPALPHSHMLWNKSSRIGTEVVYQCNSGYHNVGKGNVSICTSAGQWERPSTLCQEAMCGSPPIIESTDQVWDGHSTPGSTVLYVCKEGFYNKGGLNLSMCNENGQWTPPTLLCQDILCGDPPILPHTGQVWNGGFTPGSKVTYYCKIGFYHSEGNNMSLCSINGYWTNPNISCKEVDCGVPPPIPHSIMLWDKISTLGSQVVYQCNPGYRSVGNVSVCAASGDWDAVSLLCQEIICQEPVFKPHAKMLWDGTTHVGSVVYYQCEEGYYTRSLRNYSVCGENGLWEDIDLWCEEISCGPPLTLPHTNLRWDRTSRPGSVALYECMDGFYQMSGNNISTCLLSGQWGKVSVKCNAECGPVPFLAKSEVFWHNRSVVIHRCVDGYHSWRGSNVSVCGSNGVWQRATLRCIAIKPPVNHLSVLNEKCLHWRAEKYEEDTEVYKVTYIGSRDYERSFHDRGKRSLNSKAEQLELCLNLLPVTNYSISITALSSRFTTTITTNTSLTVPPLPVVYYREFETPEPTLMLRRSPNTLDPISLYQVFVHPLDGIMMFDCSSPTSSDISSKTKSWTEYITAQIDVKHVGTEMNFTVGDGLYYGGFFNAPLENGRNYYIILRAVSQWKLALKGSCVLWAKVKGTSYVLMVSSLSAAALIGLVAMVTLGAYFFTWFFKRT
ncbi:sushi, von Willebrand factor type A, EGF and pentraxin domain-containing protein 1 isoform X1 [Anoplopoma fimbria]|uniref:sushi, von Willebrand factor type A, EGF and pentraxin domain-containing protein 1 isoform X1 n=1 Tax=Anoplopoma fimbria TaxID=229290 RepID=UPI0023ED7A66|nr:sushi, von Willebrand factor type A, EGF and pentraxin domain-containing protein 1 isoform X1 [Anoplopoma fimbria]